MRPADIDLRVELAGDGASRLDDLHARHGAVIVRDLLPPALLDDVRHELRRLIALAHEARGRPAPSGAAFDDGFAAASLADPTVGEAIFGAARRLPAVHRLSVHPAVLALSQRLMGTDLVMVPPYEPVRIDWQPREGALLPWHQDHPYAQDSPDGIVYWVPLVDVDERNGCIEVAPGSHADGIRPVEMLEPPPGAPVITPGRACSSADESCPPANDAMGSPWTRSIASSRHHSRASTRCMCRRPRRKGARSRRSTKSSPG